MPYVICSVDGCDEKKHCRSLCRFHYDRKRKTGTTDDPAPPVDYSQGRICVQCDQFKPPSEFVARRDNAPRENRLINRCNDCRKLNYKENPHRNRERSREYYRENREEIREKSRERRQAQVGLNLWRAARRRAAELDLSFDIEPQDIKVPAECPILGIPLMPARGNSGPNSPTLDRVIPALGYIKGNVIVISHRANTIKQDATADELMKVATFVRAWAALAVAVTAQDQLEGK